MTADIETVYNEEVRPDINYDDSENHTKSRKYHGPVDIKKIHVKLIDQYGNQVNLNNMDFIYLPLVLLFHLLTV